jgi:hypothetical protein
MSWLGNLLACTKCREKYVATQREVAASIAAACEVLYSLASITLPVQKYKY